jgi:hypothetical protein
VNEIRAHFGDAVEQAHAESHIPLFDH